MLAGGTDSCINIEAVSGFSRIKALSTKFNENPTLASRPFDVQRDGFIMGEGSGVILMEELNHALERGVKKEDIYCEVIGYGLSGDSHHITAPNINDDRAGSYRVMMNALRDAQLEPKEIDYINAHATSTPLGDKVESKNIKQVFKEHSSKLLISSSKGHIGHLLGAAGSVESIFSILALKNVSKLI